MGKTFTPKPTYSYSDFSNVMKFYVAAPLRRKDDVKKIYAQIEAKGHSISSDWTDHLNIRPFSEDKESAEKYAVKDINGVINCDIFIALCHDLTDSIGTPSELTAAIALNLAVGKPEVFIVGNDTDNVIFSYHSVVQRVASVARVLKTVGKD